MTEFKAGDRVRIKLDQRHLASEWPGFEGILNAPLPEWGEDYEYHWELTGESGRSVAVFHYEIEHVDG